MAFLHFPITQIHPNAGNASVAAICAGEQGKFWEMHDLLFARQQEWQNLPPN
jgi:protein-disulfide isomerase